MKLLQTLWKVSQREMDAPVPATSPTAAPSHWRFHAGMTVLALAVIVLCAVGLPASRISVPWMRLLPKVVVVLLLVACAWYYHWRRVSRLHDLSMMALWAVVVTTLYVFPMYMAARRPVGLCDDLLTRADAALGLEVGQVVNFVEDYPWLRQGMARVYDSLILLMALAVMLPPLLARMDQAKKYALSCVLAALISIPLLAIFPAIGPWHSYGFTPDALQRQYTQVLLALRSDSWVTLDPMRSVGLITFPSFHAILALLAAATLWFVPYLRWPASLLAALIVLTTLTMGWHYVIDVLAGIVLAAGCWWLAHTILKWERQIGHSRRPA